MVRLKKSLYRLKDIARVLRQLLFDSSHLYGLNEHKAAPCVLVKLGIVSICYVQDLITNAETENSRTMFTPYISETINVKGVSIWKQFLGIKLN